MSKEFINYTINDLRVSGLQIFYDFSSYNGAGTVINSVESGVADYSGQIVNASAAFTGQSSGSGYFTDQHIEIQNTTGITSESFTIIFSQEKTGVGPATIFSDLDPNGPSGKEIGITASNKLYFKNFIKGTPYYHTLDSYPSDKNLYAVTVSELGSVGLYRVNFGNPQEKPFIYTFANPTNSAGDDSADLGKNVTYYNFDADSFVVPEYSISNGASWNIGSGEFTYQGYMDYFLYFNVDLGQDTLRRLARSVYSSHTLIPAQTGLVSGEITGYSVTATGVSGQIGSPFSITGTGTQSGFYTYESGVAQTGAVGLSGIVYSPYTGIEHIAGTDQIGQELYRRVTNLALDFSVSGDPGKSTIPNYYSTGSYWVFSGNSGTWNGASATGAPGTLFGITGFEMQTVTGYLTGMSVDLIGFSGLSGVAYSGFQYSGLRAPNITYTGSGAYFSGGANANATYFPSAISTMGTVDSSYFYEVIYDISGAEGINSSSSTSLNNTYDLYSVYLTGGPDLHETNIAINGVTSFTGQGAVSKNQFNQPQITLTSGFIVSGVEVFTQTSLSATDQILYDIVASGNRDALTISSLGDYASAPFTFDVDQKQVFFNGVKIYSGIDYVVQGGFRPSGNVTGATGVYFTYPDYSGGISQTGSGQNGVTIKHNEITPNGYVSFFNGVREPDGNLIEHSRYSDLISGTQTQQGGTIIYTMVNGVKQE
tara:strand:+ start:1168 stop:3294 length:2127 start_codon:yes stop_codon:yes gene_type:complete